MDIEYTVYDVASGAILRSGTRPYIDFLENELPEGQALLKGEALDGRLWKITEGVKVAIEPLVNLAEIDTECFASIDMQAESIRGLFITNTPSQPSIYLMKEQEAAAFVADQSTPEQNTPNLTLEAARVGKSRYEAAVTILSQAQAWRMVSAQIEDIRLRAKDAVRNASTKADKYQAIQIDWSPIESLVQ